jgi:DNA-binding transcriptional MerR regulator
MVEQAAAADRQSRPQHTPFDMSLPTIPAKRYFTIGEVGELCGVKPHVLRYWEQEFIQLRPVKRRGNRRYYQHHEVLMIRRIRELLYDQGFTISGARNRLSELEQPLGTASDFPGAADEASEVSLLHNSSHPDSHATSSLMSSAQLRQELVDIHDILVDALERTS